MAVVKGFIPLSVLIVGISLSATVAAQDDRALVVDYPAGFFQRYRPNTALDMVEQLPGFRPDDGRDERGYGGSAGNILIDGRRPASKQNAPTDMLDRIPASQVERIELIRGPVRNIELFGETEVVNVILLTDVPAAVRWEASAGVNTQTNALPLEAAVSLADLWKGTEFNTGIEIQRFVNDDRGSWRIDDGAGVIIERRDEEGNETGYEGAATLGTSTWLGQTLLQVNSQLGLEQGDESSLSRRMPVDVAGSVHSERFIEDADEFQYELGLNMQRPLRNRLTGKLILLYHREDEDNAESQLSFDDADTLTGTRLKEGEQITAEAIARVEFDWSGWTDHLLRLNLESAWNLLDNSETETEDEGDGPRIVDVPGANTRVEEKRWDLLLKDTWTVGALEFDYGLGAESSTITQTGETGLERDFFFIKPHLLVTRANDRNRQLRLRVAREISQLDFSDFVSASVFEDDDLQLGNPDLRPESVWIAELGYERRYGSIGLAGLTVFHHWIEDVEDLLPLTASEEVPGNIGNGRRWGILFEGVLPLDGFGITDARIDINGRWQDSSVTDPVTGRRRVLSATSDDEDEGIVGADNEYLLNLGYRQDFENIRVAWGLDIEVTAESPRFKVNELDIRDEGTELDMFVETTRWFGLKFRVEANNLLNQVETRERLIYTGSRGLSALERRLHERSREGRELLFSISGSF